MSTSRSSACPVVRSNAPFCPGWRKTAAVSRSTYVLGKRTDTVQEFTFAGINRAISGALTTYEVEVWVTYRDDCWDILFDARR